MDLDVSFSPMLLSAFDKCAFFAFVGRVTFCFGDLRSVQESGLERMQTYIEEKDKMCNSGWVRMEELAMEVAANNSHLLYKKWSLRSFLDSTRAVPRSGTYYII